MTTTTPDADSRFGNPPEIVNSYDPGPGPEFIFHFQRCVADVATIGGTLLTSLAIGNVPGLLVAGGVLATTALFSNIGRTHDVRERPLIETTTHIARIGERIIYKRGPKPAQVKLWKASEDELHRVTTGGINSAFYNRLANSLPVKAVYTYPRLALAKLRDFATSTGGYIYGGPSGVSFHEGVAARRLQRAGLITPNPRTQDHIRLARDWYKAKGKTLA